MSDDVKLVIKIGSIDSQAVSLRIWDAFKGDIGAGFTTTMIKDITHPSNGASTT